MLRIRRSAISLLIVLVLYTGYSLAVVPWIEPQYSAPRTTAEAKGKAGPREREWMKLFPAGAWERDELTKSLESDEGILLFQEYTRDGEGRWELTPATLIYYAASGSDKNKNKRPFLVRPRKAVLRFDGPLNLMSGGRGKLVGGRLVGDLVITSPESAPGTGDALELRTKHVEIEAKRIWTPHDVAFRFGPHSGRGRNLTIRLQPSGGGQGLSLGRMQSIELTQLNQLTILTEHGIIPSANRLERQRNSGPQSKVPVHVRCRGPFFFDVSESSASLIKEVELAREYAPNQHDYLTCDRLSIYFLSHQAARSHQLLAAQPADKTKNKKQLKQRSKTSSKWEVDRIIATGSPVRLLAPSASANFVGERLEYHPRNKQIYLRDKDLVRIQYGQHFCEAPQILYQTSDFSRLGTLRAIGPGVFRSSGPDLRVAITAKWKQEITLRPFRDNHVLSVHQDADVKLDQVNHIQAQQLHVWLREVPRPLQAQAQPPSDFAATKTNVAERKPRKQKYDIQIQRFVALGGVRLDSPQLIASTNQLEGWVRHDLSAPGEKPRDERLAQPSAAGPIQPGKKNVSKWRANADLVRVQLAQSQLQTRQQVRVDSLILRGTDKEKVILEELIAPQATDGRVYLSGDWLRMTEGLTTNPQFIVAANRGEAIVKARGLHLFARRIDLHQGRNLMWIDGTGRMSAPVGTDLHGNKLARPRRLTVQWDRRMQFNGQTAEFTDSVLVTGPQQVIRGKKLEVSLTQKVDFSQRVAFDGLKVRRQKRSHTNAADRRDNSRPEIRYLKFHGQVFVESHSLDKKQQLESVEQMWVRDLEVHRDTGKIHGLGPGRMITRRRPSSRQRAQGNLLNPKKKVNNKLNYLQVDFRSHLAGNLHARRVTLYDDIQAIYGPIVDWKSSLHNRTPDGLGERGVEILSKTLTVSEWKKTAQQKRGPLEVTAAGNTRVRGANFAAQAERLGYVEAKDLVVLESPGTDKAKIRHWNSAGGDTRELTGRKILFWPSRGEWKLENLGNFTLEGPGTFKPKLPK